jgi:hypothetical protein
MNTMKPLLKPKDVCELLQISPGALCRMSKRGKIPCMNISDSPKNATWRYDEAEIQRWLEGKRRGNRNQPPVKRRFNSSTRVIRSNDTVSQAVEKQNENGKAHGIACPVSELSEPA